MGDCWGEIHANGGDFGRGRAGREDVDVGELDDVEGTEGDGVFGVADWCYEILEM